MANNYRFPGVYPSITDLSGVVATNSTTACAFVGEAEYGPVFTPVLLSNLQDYTTKFGSLSSQYGYAGYSLAVAAETISEHRFVRVVPVGDPTSEDRSNDAKWAAGAVATKTATEATPELTGYYYEEINAAELGRDSSGDSGLFKTEAKKDMASAFIVVANDPNNRKFYVSVSDSTINENRAYSIENIDFKAGEEELEGKTLITITTASAVADGLEIGSPIVITRMSNEALNGNFTVYDFEKEDDSVKITYIVEGEQTASNISTARIGQYPDPDQTTFTLTVMEKVGRVMQTLEIYEYCTLYPSKDNFGNSMYLEDVVNGTSNYIQVFVNQNFVDEDPNAIIIPATVEAVPLNGGQSGSYKGREDEKWADLNKGWDLFKDRSQITVSLLMNSGYVNKGTVNYQSKMLEIAEHRRDCFCLFDMPMTETAWEDAADWRKNVQSFNSYRGAIFSPWVKTYDSIQGRANFVMCPSAYAARIMGTGQPWTAPAGLNRGVLQGSVVSPTGLTQYYDDTQGGILYTDNQINCMVRNPAVGYVNWGQRTLQAKPSALDRINVARTVIYIETILRDAAKWHIFENNTAYERMQITLQFNSFLDTILSSGGIARYNVVCDESNNKPIVVANNQMVIDIYLWPVFSAEYIILNSFVQSSDVTVTVTTGS